MVSELSVIHFVQPGGGQSEGGDSAIGRGLPQRRSSSREYASGWILPPRGQSEHSGTDI